MTIIERKTLDKPDERRDFRSGHIEVVNMTNMIVGRATFEPGWRWSECVKPIAGTDSCQVEHKGYCVSGRMMIQMDEGAQTEVGPGDAFHAPPGHDAWILGDEPCIMLDFSEGAATYAKK